MKLVCMALAFLMSCTGMYPGQTRFQALPEEYALTDTQTRAVEIARSAAVAHSGLSEYQFDIRHWPGELDVSSPGVYRVQFREMDPMEGTSPCWLVEISAETEEVLRVTQIQG